MYIPPLYRDHGTSAVGPLCDAGTGLRAVGGGATSTEVPRVGPPHFATFLLTSIDLATHRMDGGRTETRTRDSPTDGWGGTPTDRPAPRRIGDFPI